MTTPDTDQEIVAWVTLFAIEAKNLSPTLLADYSSDLLLHFNTNLMPFAIRKPIRAATQKHQTICQNVKMYPSHSKKLAKLLLLYVDCEFTR
jgi:hypothetical protein